MKCDFVVGQKICLINDFSADAMQWAKENKVTLPFTGIVYTVREIVATDDGIGIRLCEIDNSNKPEKGYEQSFWPHLFRPVVTRKTNIAIFTAMLNASKEKVPS